MTEAASRLPAFCDAVPPIVLHDPLAELLGAAGEGGFKGLAGQHGRRGLLRFGAPTTRR